MVDHFGGGKINSPDYWNKRFFEDWIAKDGRRQTEFFAELLCRELPRWLAESVRERKYSIFDYGCALGDALPVLQRAFPLSSISGGDVAQVGLGLARALHPAFEFVDINALGEAIKVADIIYCSNTLEHFENWQEILNLLSRHAREYVILLVPFEEEERIDEHVSTFEFNTLPPRLPSGARLLHLGVFDAGLEAETQWNGMQLIAIYGKRRSRIVSGASAAMPQRDDRLVFDLRSIGSPSVPPLLASLAAMSHGKRRLARELSEARKRAHADTAAHNAALHRIDELERSRATLQSETAKRTDALEAALNRFVRVGHDLIRGVEDAERKLIDRLTPSDRDRSGGRQMSSAPEDWPTGVPDGQAVQTTLDRLTETVQRTNRVGAAFDEQAGRWLTERSDLNERLRQMRRAFETALGERDRARSQVRALEEIAAVGRVGTAGGAAPLVSIALPVYNQAYLVDEAIAGVRSQTYENWELIVIDDGSTDDLETRVRHYLNDRRVVLLRQPNQKLPAALNHAFGYARGELLTWTSADNIMLPSQLERLVEELVAHPDVGLVYSDYWAIDDNGEPLAEPTWRAHNRDPEIPSLIRLPHQVTIENFHRGDNFIGASFLYRRQVADIVGRYADDTFGGEDYDFWLRMHLVTEFRHVAEPLYKYRVHDNTLSSRAEELGLHANIRELLEADRWRIDTLLVDGSLHSGGSVLRPVSQFHHALLKRCRQVAYQSVGDSEPTGIAAERPLGDSAIMDPLIIDIDVPARAVDAARLHHADILLCRSELSASLLRQEDWTRDKRILSWDGETTPALQHAFIQTFAGQVTAPVIMPARPVPPQIDEPFRPARILLLVDRWSSGGLENIVIDLAHSLAGNGRAVFVASGADQPPPASAFAGGPVRTLSFHGDEDAFESFLRREAIEVVNYHHSFFAAERAKRQAAATVYTMHNCYLWMDDAARQRVAVGLAKIDRVIAVSRQVAQFAIAQFGIPCDRIVVVPNGLRDDIVNRATFSSSRRMWGGGDAPFTVAMVASLTRPKLQHVAIAAFAETASDIPQLRLRLIGEPVEPAYRQELEAQIGALSEGHRVELVGGLTRPQTIDALAEAQVFLLPSLVEGCSMALLEAAAAGCVCVASDVGGARDLLAAGGPVVLVPSPLGELDRVTQRQFLDAATSGLPEHRQQVAGALRLVWRDYGPLAAAAPTRASLSEICGMQQMTDSYLLAYTLALRGGACRGNDLARELAPPARGVALSAAGRLAPA